ncbi:MAG: HEPN domain-containing protein [bacterium]|nr:HEPN domain-containing protein [bacterium]
MQKDIGIQIQNRIKRVPLEIVSVVLYGSWAKKMNQEDSDIDLLVVARGIHSRRIKRGKEIAAIKKGFSLGLPLDILLVTEEEARSNFENYNPLYLDVATEGEIIFDKEFIKPLIKETDKYILLKGVEKLDDGWRFPVAMRSASYLSEVSQKDFARVMLVDGERDYQIGEKLKEEGFFDKSVYHFQQAAEKAIKSVLISFGIFKKTHFIGEVLLEEIEKVEVEKEWKARLKKIAIINEEIEPEVSLSRYPGIDHGNIWIPYEEYRKEDATEASKKTLMVVDTAKEFYEYWFKDK